MKYKFLATILSSAALGWTAPPDPKTTLVKPTALELQHESLRKQRESLKQQRGVQLEDVDLDSGFLTPINTLVVGDCPPLDAEETESLIASAAAKHSLPPELMRAVMHRESGFKPCAVSAKGAQGLMQLMPATAAQLHVADPFDPEQNVQAGALFLKQLLKKYNGDLRLALVAYNAGTTRADQLDASQYPAETHEYIANIFADLGNPE